MGRTTTYDELASLASGLKAGDSFAVGPDDVSPNMIETLTSLSLTFTMTVTRASVDVPAKTVTVAGVAKMLGIAGMLATMTFTPKDLRKTAGAFVMSLSATPPVDTQWELLDNFVLSGMTIGFEPNTEVDVYCAFIECTLKVGSTGSLELPIRLDIPIYRDIDWTLTGEFESQPLSADALSSLAGGMDLSQYLPFPLDTLAKFGMTEVELAFDPAKGKLSYAYLVMVYSEEWSILNVVHVPGGGIQLRFMVDFRDSKRSYVEMEAQFDIETAPVDIGAHFAPDNFIVWGRLQEGKTLNIKALFEYFKVPLPSGFPGISISRLGIIAYISDSKYTFDMQAQISAESALKVKDLTAQVSVVNSTVNATVNADFSGAIVIDETTTLFLEAKYDGKGGGLTLSGDAENVPIGSIIAYWASEFGISEDTIPAPIRSLALKTLTTDYDTSSGDFSFKCVGDFTVSDKPVEVTFAANVAHTKEGDEALDGTIVGENGYSATFAGKVTFTDLEFDIIFDTQSSGLDIFVADYRHTGEDPKVKLKDLVAGVSKELANTIPEDISIGLKGVKFAFLGKEAGDKRAEGFLFGVELGANIDLSDLPLIGDKLPPGATLSVDDLQVVFNSEKIDKQQVVAINGLLPDSASPFPSDGDLPKGLTLCADLALAAERRHLSLSLGSDGTELRESTDVVARNDESQPAVCKWFDVQKQLGVVQFKRVGVEYRDNRLFFLLDTAIILGALTLTLDGLAVGSALDRFAPAFRLDGLGLSYVSGPIEMAGALLRIPEEQLPPGTEFQFDGDVVLRTESFCIAAIGSYARLAGGEPSLFVFAVAEKALGGPPALFVLGLMGGFGFNRSLAIPAQDRVEAFPLLKLASQGGPPPNLPDVLDKLESGHWIEPEAGASWLAFGLIFTSFELVHSRALLIAKFGREFELDLLGISTIRLPQPAEGKEDYAYAELELEATLKPSEGIFSLTAVLAPSSYVITPHCRLTGGFALYLWFDPNDHAGQFVLTMGGYHPAFKPPTYFPRVPRLGFNWPVSEHVTIKGDAYLALTPSCVMAGGGLEVLFHDGDLRAWFTAHADFLIAWRPFYYTASIAVSVGVSYRLNLLFCHKTVSVSVGASVDMWGPPTGGRVHVHLSVVSFTVHFGSDGAGATTEALKWEEFLELLPAQEDVCKIVSVGGLSKTLPSANGGSKAWVVRSKDFSFATESAIPASQLVCAIPGGSREDSSDADAPIDILPMNKTGVSSSHRLTIEHEGKFPDLSGWSLGPRRRDVPASLWGTPPKDFSHIPKRPAAELVKGRLVGYIVHAPRPTMGSFRGVVPLKNLDEDLIDTGAAPITPTASPSPDYVPSPSDQVVRKIGGIMDDTVKKRRDALYVRLQACEVFSGSNGPLVQMASRAGHIFSDKPMVQTGGD